MTSNWFKLILKLTKVQYGKNLKLKGIPVIYNTTGAKLQIGDNVTVNSSFLSNLVGLYQRTIIVTRTPQAELIIGDNVGISGATIYARERIKIGDNTLVGGNAKIFDNDFHPLEIEARNKDIKEKIGTRQVVIGKNCFIGGNSIILKGTVLGDGCIVGAGAVVSGKFEDNCIIAGNPARVIKNIRNNKEENLITK
jgi:acetyltransferase-like isoleucine patch superfamily enzyme